ncbi:long-chain-acyl-CoA synthetase [Thalassotalea ponticola]|uniref:long-chain-acyl-CoA synthetase n=1 Tax=Thalassotalea ponticola TaxID=1523392 RepID=UPI0025B499A7|nr:long-chain-acyl-CoA synthetase [Thalassotalea ponticola]MDN3653824.1 long-chain-acyl-CoA synthetase [Thalassotalea ponticola]
MTTNLMAKEPALTTVVDRQVTQAKMDKRASAAMRIKPKQQYTVADRLEAQALLHADKPFIIYQGKAITYQQINEQANRYAQVLHSLGLRAGDTCAMALENRPEFFIVWFALAKIGAVTAFLNTHVSGVPLAHAINSTEAKGVIVGDECINNFIETPELDVSRFWRLSDVETDISDNLSSQFSKDLEQRLSALTSAEFDASSRADIVAEDPMLLIFTSGTTGLPKAAVYSHLRWLCSGDVMEVTIDATSDDVFYCCLPLYHGAAATSVTSTALACGGAIVVRRKFSVSKFWQEIAENQVTVCQYIGEICRYLLNRNIEAPAHRLRAMMGAGLSAESWQRWIEAYGEMDIYEGWGSTESNTNLINLDNHIGSCGRIPDWQKTNFRLVQFDVEANDYIRDDNGFCILCQPGEVGEGLGMIINHPDIGAGRFEGYTNKRETEGKIIRNVFTQGDAYWRSGDLLRYDADGYFYFVDRIGDTFRWKSENVSTQEVATILTDYQDAEFINVYGVLVPEHEGRAGMASIVMQPNKQFNSKQFYQLATEKLPHYAAPLFVRVSEQADMTTTFKLRKVDLQKQGYSPELCDDPLYVKDDSAGDYVQYNEHVLARLGLPKFLATEA